MPEKIIVIQPNIQHYRLPVFDQLREVIGTTFSLEVCGTMKNNEAIGGGRRDYFRNFPLRQFKIGSRPVAWWPGIIEKIKNDKPKAVISTVYPSNLTCWKIPHACKKIKAVPIAWTKVQSPSPHPVTQRVKAALFTRYQYILAYGQLSREELVDLGYSDRNIYVTNNTIDTDRIFSNFESLKDHANQVRHKNGLTGKRILLCISKMEPHKRHQDILDAWPQIRRLDPDLHLVLIGSGALEEKIRRDALLIDRTRIRFIGRVPAGQDYHWIAAADATIQCGAVGVAINQSMAFGKPTIIANETGPDTESLIDGKTGFRYEKCNLEDLVTKVKLALSNDPVVKAIAVNAQVMIREHYSVENMVSKIQQCLFTALDHDQ